MKWPAYTPVIVVAAFAGFLALEKIRPLRKRHSAWMGRLLLNMAISGLAFLTALWAVKPALTRALAWANEASFGLVPLITSSSRTQFVLGFLLLDLSFYYWHIVNHKIPIFWRFHNVHHFDPDLDVSTGFRFHFGEVLFSTVFRVIQASVTGVSFGTFAVYELVFQANTLFQHSNLRLSIRAERLLNLILVTPRMHGIHHSQVRPEANSNFGVVFSWWDKLHRTVTLNVAQSKIEVGIAGYSRQEDNQFWSALRLPFGKQRDYWRRPDGMNPERPASDLSGSPNVLAE